jgi:hypothetical protein
MERSDIRDGLTRMLLRSIRATGPPTSFAPSNPAVLDLRCSVDAVAGLVAKALQPGEVEAHNLAAALHDLAGDQHRVDILRAHMPILQARPFAPAPSMVANSSTSRTGAAR